VALKSTVKVLPDPHFPVSDADRQSREASVMSAYTLQQQLLPARDAAQTLGQQITAMRQYLTSAGEGGQTALAALEKAAPDVGRISGEVSRTLAAAGRVETAIDGYDGLPTAAQLREIDWAWEDAVNAVAGLNKLIEHQMPPVYKAIGNAVQPEVVPVAPLGRPK
jgi:hypothetical protein